MNYVAIIATSPLESINTCAFYDVCTVSHGADTLQVSQLHTLPPMEGTPRIKNQYSCPPNVAVEGHQKSRMWLHVEERLSLITKRRRTPPAVLSTKRPLSMVDAKVIF